MSNRSSLAGLIATLCVFARVALSQQGPPPAAYAAKSANDPIASLVDQLNLERYKATIKSLTQFGDRRQGTDRNRAAIDWIEAQLKSYGCTNTERIHYNYQPPAGRGRGAGAGGDFAAGGDAAPGRGAGAGGAAA